MAMDFPNTPAVNAVFTSGGVSWIWTGTVWKAYTVPGAGAVISDTAPPSTLNGSLWWNSSPGDGQLYISYYDGTSTQYVVCNNLGSGVYLPLTGGTATGPITINTNTVMPPPLLFLAPQLYIIGANNGNTQFVMDAFGAGTAEFTGRQARGTAAAPTASQTGDYLALFGGVGHAATNYQGGFGVFIGMQASQNWTDSAQGSQIVFDTVPNGATAVVQSLLLQGNQASFFGSNAYAPGCVAIWAPASTDAQVVLNPSQSGAHQWNLNGRSTGEFWLYDQTVGTNRMRIDTTGNVYFYNQVYSSGPVGGFNFADRNNNTQWSISVNNNVFCLWNATNGNIITSDISGNFVVNQARSSSIKVGAWNHGGASWATINSNFALANSGCMGVAWNYSAGWGETDFFINRGAGGVGANGGGLAIVDFPNTSGNPLMVFRVDGVGNIGLAGTGGAVPTDMLAPHIVGGTGAPLLLVSMTPASGTILSANLYYTGTAWKYIAGGAGSLNQVTGGITWYSAPSGAAGGAATITLTGSIDASGNLTMSGATCAKPGGGPWATASARELKQDIQPYQQGLEAILGINPVRYRFNDDSGFPSDETHIGLVHDEVSHMPEMHRKVTIGKGWEEPGREVDALDSSALTYALINAVKELTKRLEAVEGKL